MFPIAYVWFEKNSAGLLTTISNVAPPLRGACDGAREVVVICYKYINKIVNHCNHRNNCE